MVDVDDSITEADRSIKAPAINRIDSISVLRICSSQVILDLATAVKELVENALDAGATQIDIRIKEHGLKGVEVQDNGPGVEPSDYAGLTKRYATSKIKKFSDLEMVNSYGFRGEALSSLAALARLTITTRTAQQAHAVELEYDATGEIISQKPAAGGVGTTVCIRDLFRNLPVRQREFTSNIKKEYAKLISTLQSYAIVCTDIRITVVHQDKKGVKSRVLSTAGCSNLKETLTAVYGPKFMQTMVPFEAEQTPFKITGFVSQLELKACRNNTNQQHLFLNRRPIEHQKIVRTINEVYRSLNPGIQRGGQYPAFALCLDMPPEEYDVNVTPDKKMVFFTKESQLLQLIQDTLNYLFKDAGRSYELSQAISLPDETVPQNDCNESESQKGISENGDGNFADDVDNAVKLKRRESLQRLEAFAATTTTISTHEEKLTIHSSQSSQLVTSTSKSSTQPTILSFTQKLESTTEIDIQTSNDSDPPSSPSNCETAPTEGTINIPSQLEESEQQRNNDSIPQRNTPNTPTAKLCVTSNNSVPKVSVHSKEKSSSSKATSERDRLLQELMQMKSRNDDASNDNDFETDNACSKPSVVEPKSGNTNDMDTEIIVDSSLPATQSTQQRSTSANFSLKRLREKTLARYKALEARKLEAESNDSQSSKFKAKMNVASTQEIEAELSRHVKKEHFAQMEIIGQFNRGFIITKLGSDLFILDQHASDEKYNFEQLQATTKINQQKLLKPMQLELCALDEMIICDNLEVFRANGFDFDINYDRPVTQRVQLTAYPFSKSAEFGIADVMELIALLKERPGEMVRLSRIRSVIASRACRKSIMVGDPLDMRQMREIVDHMQTMTNPWNCPHGRPTMRHLIDLNQISARVASAAQRLGQKKSNNQNSAATEQKASPTSAQAESPKSSHQPVPDENHEVNVSIGESTPTPATEPQQKKRKLSLAKEDSLPSKRQKIGE